MSNAPLPEGYSGKKKSFISTDPWPLLYGAMQNRTILEGEIYGLEPHPLNPELGLCLIVMFNTVKGIIPTDELGEDNPKPGLLARMVGQCLSFKVLRIYRAEKIAVLSRKVVKEEQTSRTWRVISMDQTITVTAKAILPGKGAIVDIGMVPAFMPITEISWGWVKDITKHVKPGDTFDVKVIRLNKEERKVFVSLKALLPDPWETAPQKYLEDGQYPGRVTCITERVIFVNLEDGIDCICSKPLEVKFDVGSRVLIQINRLRPEKRIIEGRLRMVISP